MWSKQSVTHVCMSAAAASRSRRHVDCSPMCCRCCMMLRQPLPRERLPRSRGLIASHEGDLLFTVDIVALHQQWRRAIVHTSVPARRHWRPAQLHILWRRSAIMRSSADEDLRGVAGHARGIDREQQPGAGQQDARVRGQRAEQVGGASDGGRRQRNAPLVRVDAVRRGPAVHQLL